MGSVAAMGSAAWVIPLTTAVAGVAGPEALPWTAGMGLLVGIAAVGGQMGFEGTAAAFAEEMCASAVVETLFVVGLAGNTPAVAFEEVSSAVDVA